MIELISVFVACQINLLVCIDILYLSRKNIFTDTDKCRAYVNQVIKKESAYRRKYNDRYSVVMGKCRFYIRK